MASDSSCASESSGMNGWGSPNPNEARALTLLSQELGRPVFPWCGKKHLPAQMASLPDITHPDYTAENDGAAIWSIEAIADQWQRIIPDGYLIEPQTDNMLLNWNPRCHHLALIEVETTNRMTEPKLEKYAWLWDAFQQETQAWELHVIVWDWYDQWHEVDCLRLLSRSISIPDPARNPNDLLRRAKLDGDRETIERVLWHFRLWGCEPVMQPVKDEAEGVSDGD